MMAAVIAGLGGLAGLLPAFVPAAHGNALARERDPLVLTGAQIPGLNGVAPDRIVAFRFEAGWVQIPVQVDERAVVDWGTIYHTFPTGFTVLTYTDPGTFTGPDPNPAFDADDELVLMGKDAGDAAAPGNAPAGVVIGSGVELTITNPLTGATGRAYLFESDGSLDPGAGENRVSYNFVLLSGDYKDTYNLDAGPNPEDSIARTEAYGVHFADRWIRDETNVTRDGATGADILDRHKPLFAPGDCTRSEETFSNGEGAFIVNRTGPLRALRGYVGANSGPTTYRIHAFYESREDLFTALRVHPIGGIMDYFDYSPAAAGMVYRDDLNPAGVLVDGNPDQVTAGQFAWEMVTGDPGTLAMTSLLRTDIAGFTYTLYYSDDTTPPATQCTGDPYEYGASGFWRNGGIPNTDPILGPYKILELTRVIAYGGPDQDLPFGETCAREAQNPLTAVAAPYAGNAPVAEDVDGEALRMAVGPNPSRGLLRIAFTMVAPGPFTLTLHDASGRLAATPVSGFFPAGLQRRDWNGSDLPDGVYYGRVSSDGSRAAGSVRIVRVH